MKEEIKYSINKFKNAVNRLKEGVAQVKDELDEDGVIQRFEFTFELLWKTLKIYLEDEGVQCKTPKECLKEAFRIDLMEDGEIFLDMLEDRNRTLHIYNKKESEKIFQRIKNDYLAHIEKILNKLIC